MGYASSGWIPDSILSRFNYFRQDDAAAPASGGLRAEEEQRLASLFREKTAHKGWDILNLPVRDGETYTGFSIPADAPRGIVVFMTGCESNPLMFPRAVKKMRDNGFHVLAAPQVNRRQYPDHIERNADLTEWFTLDDESPVQKLKKLTGLPVYLVAHSAAVLMCNKAFLKPENADKASDTFDHYFKMAGFFGPARASPIPDFVDASRALRLIKRTTSLTYSAYATACSNYELGKGPLDKLVIGLFHPQKSLAEYLVDSAQEEAEPLFTPTHGDALKFKAIGYEVLNTLATLKETGTDHPFLGIPSTSYIGAHDPASSPRLAQAEATLTGAEVVPVEAGHNILAQCPDVLPHIMSVLEEKSAEPIEMDQSALFWITRDKSRESTPPELRH